MRARYGASSVLRGIDLKKSILEIYALAVCFFTVACFVITLGLALYAIVGVANPSFTMNSYQYMQFQTNDAFLRGCGIGLCQGARKDAEEPPSEADVTKGREEAYSRALSNETRESEQTLLKFFLILVVDSGVFAGHWVMAQRARVTCA
jgi:hypothetical protein